MSIAIGFFVGSLVLCILVNVGAVFAEKIQKKRTKKMVKDTKQDA